MEKQDQQKLASIGLVFMLVVFAMGLSLGYVAGYECGKVDTYNKMLDVADDVMPGWMFNALYWQTDIHKHDKDGDKRIDRPLWCV